MALRTPEEYKESIRDGRNLYYRGQRVEDPTEHPALKLAVDHACIDFAMSHDPQYRDLATVFDPDIGEHISRYYYAPRSSEDLLKRSELTQVGVRLGDGLLLWTRSVPSDGLVALSIVARKIDAVKETGYGERVERYRRHCAMNDLALSAAMTDARGEPRRRGRLRSKPSICDLDRGVEECRGEDETRGASRGGKKHA